MKNMWISTEDRLPYVGKYVLVHIPDEFPFPTVREGFLLQSGMWFVNGCEHGPSEVTHWMPMPELPTRGRHY